MTSLAEAAPKSPARARLVGGGGAGNGGAGGGGGGGGGGGHPYGGARGGFPDVRQGGSGAPAPPARKHPAADPAGLGRACQAAAGSGVDRPSGRRGHREPPHLPEEHGGGAQPVPRRPLARAAGPRRRTPPAPAGQASRPYTAADQALKPRQYPLQR